jgi:integrase
MLHDSFRKIKSLDRSLQFDSLRQVITLAQKRSAGSGSIKKLSNGLWRGQIMDGYKSDGKRNIISFTGRLKGEVQDKIYQYWVQKELIGIDYSRNTPFNTWADTWYRDYETEVEPSTYSGYKYTLNILKEYFADTPVSDIRALDINHFLDSMRLQNRSKSYVTKTRSMLIQIFDYAEANQLISMNPARKAKLMKDKKNLRIKEPDPMPRKAFTETEIDCIKKFAEDDLLGHSILILLGAGLRTQELLALTAADIAPDGSTIRINKAIKTVGGSPQLGPPKSERGHRTVPVPQEFRQDALYLRNHGGKQYVWTSQRENGLFDVNVFRKKYYKAVKKIPGVRPLSPHCCRHTYVSSLEKNGVPMEQIARLAGHSRITTTDGYLHTDIDTLSVAVSVLNRSTDATNDRKGGLSNE